MARTWTYGDDLPAVTLDRSGNVMGGIPLTVWTAKTGGTQVTDLEVLNAAGSWIASTTVTTWATGKEGCFAFRSNTGPEVWVRDPAGNGYHVTAHESYASALAQVEASNAAAVAEAISQGAAAGAAAGGMTDANLTALLANTASTARATLDSAYRIAKPGLDVILILGQSNASGNGHPVLPESLDRPVESVLMYQTSATAADSGSIRPASEPVSYKWDGSPGVGPGTEFGRRHAATLPAGRRVLLVPLAYGGTSLSVGNAEWGTGGVRRVAALKRAADAIDAAAAYGKVRVSHIIWVQGEGDTLGGATQSGYTAALKSLVADFRALPYAERAKLCIGSMVPDWADVQSNLSVRSALRAANAEIHNTFFAWGPYGQDSETDEAGNFTTQGIHYSAIGARELGGALWEASLRNPARVATRRNYCENPLPLGGAEWVTLQTNQTLTAYTESSWGPYIAVTSGDTATYLGAISPQITVAPGVSKVTVAGNVLATGTVEPVLNVRAFSASGTQLASVQSAAAPLNVWTRLVQVLTVPVGTAYIVARFVSPSPSPGASSSSYRLQKVTIEMAETSGSWFTPATVPTTTGPADTMPPHQPVIPRITALSSTSLAVRVIGPVGSTGYSVRRREFGTSAWTTVDLGNVQDYTINSLTGALIEVQVQARNANGVSAWSRSAFGTPVMGRAIVYADTLGVGPGHWSAAYNPGGKYAGININQPAVALRPFINRDTPAYEFSGGQWWTMGDHASASLADGSGAWTIAGVFTNRMSGTEPGGIFGWRSEAINYGSLYCRADGTVALQWFTPAQNPGEIVSVQPKNTPLVVIGERGSSAAALWVNGAQVASAAASTLTSATASQAVIGAAYRQNNTTPVLQAFTGDVACLILIKGTLSATEKAGLSAWLAQRYMVGGK